MNIFEAYQQISSNQLEEGKIANTIIGTALVASSMMTNVPSSQEMRTSRGAVTLDPAITQSYVSKITDKYKAITKDKASEIVSAVVKHAKLDFPQQHHLLGLIGTESSFNENARSGKLKHDVAKGLTQIRPGIWNIPHAELSTVEGQVKHGADILHSYYKKLGSKDAAIQAYNLGITNFKKGKTNIDYLNKVKTESALFKFKPD